MTIRHLSSAAADFDQALEDLLAWETVADSALQTQVQQIIQQVREEGDIALLALTQQYDHHPADSMDALHLSSAELTQALERKVSSVFYESPHRILKTLEVLANVAPDHLVCVARELTKKFEEYHRGKAKEVFGHYSQKPPKGEICVVIAGTDLPKWTAQ